MRSQVVRSERFLKKWNVLDTGRLVGIPGDQKSRQTGSETTDLLDQSCSVHARHCVVGHQGIDSGPGAQDRQRRFAAVCRQHAIAQPLQDCFGSDPHEIVVIDEQNHLFAAAHHLDGGP